MNETRLISVFVLGLDLGVLLGVLGSGVFAFVVWLRLRNKNRGGNNAHGKEEE